MAYRAVLERIVHTAALAFLATGFAGCTVNPVTGKSELVLVSAADEVRMGEQAYVPSQQSQGGVYDVDPRLTAYVQSVGHKLAAVSDRDLPYEFVILNNSVPNAWAMPGGKIAINRGLLTELDNEAELAAVLGHEIVHAAARHSAQQMTRGMLSQVLVVATAVAASDSDYGSLAVGGAGLGAQLINSTYGRGAELESDYYGMRYMSEAGYDPQGAVTLQETFVRLSEGGRQDWLSGLFASHPPSQARVDANRETAVTLPPGGKLGRDEYRLAMQKTMQAMPAYEAYDEGRKALADGDREKALELADRALSLFPEEANFHALRGDVRLVEENYGWAVTNYGRAIERRGDFFYYHLQRGLANNELGETDAAVRDLERSIELLPTAPAHLTLGNIARDRGDVDGAISHYKVVAGAQGEYGQRASAELARLDIGRNPSAYVARACEAASNGNLVVLVQNKAGVAITDVRIAIGYNDASGRAQSVSRTISSVIDPNEIVSLDTGLGPYTGGGCPAEIVAARVAE